MWITRNRGKKKTRITEDEISRRHNAILKTISNEAMCESDIGKTVGLPDTTVYRYLTTLLERGLIEKAGAPKRPANIRSNGRGRPPKMLWKKV
jgi:predicted ArsR family transcriptional regulator